jgi:hypothetical protein
MAVEARQAVMMQVLKSIAWIGCLRVVLVVVEKVVGLLF